MQRSYRNYGNKKKTNRKYNAFSKYHWLEWVDLRPTQPILAQQKTYGGITLTIHRCRFVCTVLEIYWRLAARKNY
jgi:hypothetical protein